MDVSSYEDMSDLLLISDMLITDYSSSAGDFALLNKPIILYQEDREAYVKEDRTFYFDIDKSPYWVVKNQEELFSKNNNFTDEDVKINCKKVLDFYVTNESGESSGKIIEYMMLIK
ncbi:CDP-glycerol:poly(glycerophosphate) glycerophosphotransferase [termite gut metagenome]|uniref:CDP-glycerol:poly(Glycerophosphate) glycerophosphotransferase n=1 Tax=termite gut metagenome TaxID=433724 RepID=A0A5J4QZL5_9ZZZZ